MIATIKQGSGYWDVTVYPVGGCFRRAQAPVELTEVEVIERYRNGAARTLKGKAGAVRVVVGADVCATEGENSLTVGGIR